MKKIIIGAAIAAVLGAGVYFGKDKIGNTVANVGETQITEFITENLNKPIIIKQLQSHPLVKKATITITEKTDTTIRSQLDLASADGESITIPLNSEIIRGKVDYNGKSFGFGKIVTTPDLSGIEGRPIEINNDTFKLEQYIDLIGNVSELYHVAPIKLDGSNGFDFKGLEIALDTQLLDRSEFDANINFKGLSGEELSISSFNYAMELDEDGNYTANAEPFQVLAKAETNKTVSIDFSKSTYTGVIKKEDGLDMPINNADAIFDSLTFGDDEMKFTIDNLKISGGLYKAGKNNNLAAKISGDFDPTKLPTQAPNGQPIPVKPKSFVLDYALNNLSNNTLNVYQGLVNSAEFDDASVESLIKSLQADNAQFDLSANLTAEEGKIDNALSLAINKAGKAADTKKLVQDIKRSSESAAKYFNGNLLITLDESLANATGLTGMAQMFLGIRAENGELKLAAELKDGKATMNGQSIPLQ